MEASKWFSCFAKAISSCFCIFVLEFTNGRSYSCWKKENLFYLIILKLLNTKYLLTRVLVGLTSSFIFRVLSLAAVINSK